MAQVGSESRVEISGLDRGRGITQEKEQILKEKCCPYMVVLGEETKQQ